MEFDQQEVTRSDLIKLHNDILMLRRDFDHHAATEKDMFLQMVISQQENTDAVRQLTEGTASLLEAWHQARAIVKVGSALGKLGKWVGSIAIFGAIINWLANHS